MKYEEQIADDFLFEGGCPHDKHIHKIHCPCWWNEGAAKCCYCGYLGTRWEYDKDWILEELEETYSGLLTLPEEYRETHRKLLLKEGEYAIKTSK